MCGIAGIFLTPSSADSSLRGLEGGYLSVEEVIRRMTASMAHRGPDGCGTEQIRSGQGMQLGLGHRRLAIIDLSPRGRQPMLDQATGNWISFNGEVVNYRLLAPELGRADPWRSQTDTEVVLRAYAKWGRQCVDRLRGMFAFAIWDAQRRMLFLARDRLGVKPLYYYTSGGVFVFASEIRALLATGLVPRRLDPVAVWGYLGYQAVPAPRSLIEGVQVLPAGSWLTVDSEGAMFGGRYWHLLERASAEAAGASWGQSRRRVGELLREAVALQLVSDVPVGAFLSGGLDSTAVVALMREAGGTPRTFSVGFSERAFDEAPYARMVASRFRTDHTEISLKEADLLDQLPDAVAAMDQPTGDGVNAYVVSRAVRSAGVTVALSGLGGDEFFAGYPSFRRISRLAGPLRLWSRVPAAVRGRVARTVEALGGSSVAARKVAGLLESDGTVATMFPLMRQVLSEAQRQTLLAGGQGPSAPSARDPYVAELQQAYAGSFAVGLLSQVSYAEGWTYLQDVLLRDTDQMSMVHGLEVRVPLLDHELVEYVMGVPDVHKRPHGVPKRLLVESIKGLVPDEIVRRPKQGFVLPFEPWMRGALRAFCAERLELGRVAARGLFRPEAVQALWNAFLEGRGGVSWSRLWVLVVLEEWLERHGVSGVRVGS
jgi:asparagine synthase (glutamine-hydrolysing)